MVMEDDYLQTVTYSKIDDKLNSVSVSKRLGELLKDYSRNVPTPVVMFAQLKPKSNDLDFSARFLNDQTIVNHATIAMEVAPNAKTELTDFIVHKMRFGVKPKDPISVRFEGGRFEPDLSWKDRGTVHDILDRARA